MELLLAVTGGLLIVTAIPYLFYLGLYAYLRPHGSPATKEPWTPGVSIVLPTYNEAQIVESKLEDICSLNYPQEKLEVVVVDASDDATPIIVEKFFEDRESPSLELIREADRRGLAPALNDAYHAATSEVVVKTDCDSRLAADAVREATANLTDPEIGAVTGRNAEVLGGSAVEAGYRNVQALVQVVESHVDSTFIFHGPFSAFLNDVIVQIDSESLADDTELAVQIRRNGKRVVFDPAVRYQEAAHSAFRKRRQQKDRRALGLIQILVQHRDALFKYGRYGRVVLPSNWWFMVVSPWLLAGVFLIGSAAALTNFGIIGLGVPVGLGVFVWLGLRERLGPLQPAYSLLDTQISLLRAGIGLIRHEGDGTWEVDEELRESYNP